VLEFYRNFIITCLYLAVDLNALEFLDKAETYIDYFSRVLSSPSLKGAPLPALISFKKLKVMLLRLRLFSCLQGQQEDRKDIFYV